jgi:sulfur-carrier protein
VARSYVLDDQSELRKHMNVFVDGNRVRDRVHLSDPVPADAEVYIIQALSGG